MINVDKAIEFVLSCMNFDGGFGCRPGSESHAGQVRYLNCFMQFSGVFVMSCRARNKPFLLSSDICQH